MVHRRDPRHVNIVPAAQNCGTHRRANDQPATATRIATINSVQLDFASAKDLDLMAYDAITPCH
jgi:hypothetical protein